MSSGLCNTKGAAQGWFPSSIHAVLDEGLLASVCHPSSINNAGVELQRLLRMPQFMPHFHPFAVLSAVPTADSIWGMCSKHCNTHCKRIARSSHGASRAMTYAMPGSHSRIPLAISQQKTGPENVPRQQLIYQEVEWQILPLCEEGLRKGWTQPNATTCQLADESLTSNRSSSPCLTQAGQSEWGMLTRRR